MPETTFEFKQFGAGIAVLQRLGMPTAAPTVPTEGDIWYAAGALHFETDTGTLDVPLTGGMTLEELQDLLGPWLAGDVGDIDATYDDAGSTIGFAVKARAITVAKMQAIATARFLGRVAAGSGDIEELTADQVTTALALVAADISDFVTNARTSITVADSSTVDFSYAGGEISATVLDSPTVGGMSAAEIQTAVVDAISNGASAAYDTLVELQALLEADDTALAGLTTQVSLRARFFDGAIPNGAPSGDVTHGYTVTQIGSLAWRTYVAATGVTEGYHVEPTVGFETTKLTVSRDDDVNIAAGRRIFVTVGAT
jgi:hypothetical protein